MEQQSREQDPHILKTLDRAWAWRRKLENGEAATVHDSAKAEKVTDRFVSRTMRLAYLSPEVLERRLIAREPPAVTVIKLIGVAYLRWGCTAGRVFGERHELK